MRGDPPERGFVADLEFLENRDLDLSVRLGAMLASNALMITIGTHPISASPGAPLSLDAATQPVLTVASMIGIVPLIVSSYLCLRALLLGEELDFDGLEDEAALRQRLFAAFLRSIDAQARMIRGGDLVDAGGRGRDVGGLGVDIGGEDGVTGSGRRCRLFVVTPA
jgi:hypothetical protein